MIHTFSQTSRETNENETICYCNHLTDFGGGGPSPKAWDIDLADAFSGFLELENNPVVFSVCMILIGVFVLLMFWARRKDDKLHLKVCIAFFFRVGLNCFGNCQW